MEILVLAPMYSEYKNFCDALNKSTNLNNHYHVVECGVGKANAAATAALEIFNDHIIYDLIAVIGYCAASPLYKPGDFLMPSLTRYHDVSVPEGLVPELTAVYPLQGCDDCTILTGDTFITAQESSRLVSLYGKSVLFDMEASAVAQVASETSTPLTVLKLVSDIPEVSPTFSEFVQSHSDFSQFLSALELLSS